MYQVAHPRQPLVRGGTKPKTLRPAIDSLEDGKWRPTQSVVLDWRLQANALIEDPTDDRYSHSGEQLLPIRFPLN
jgi:hypothetical protein